MKTIRRNDGSVDGTRVAALVGASVGLGLLVHEVFFLVGGAIAVGALAAAVTRAAQPWNANAFANTKSADSLT